MRVKSIEVLKGGSLGTTELIETEMGELRVRKSINSAKNREYGVVRWHSQLKRLQRYNALVPGIFPKVLELGISEDTYFFDIEYFPGYLNLKSYFCDLSPTQSQIQQIAARVMDDASRLHKFARFDTYPGSLQVYLQEEVLQRLADAREDPIFRNFTEAPTVFLNGVGSPSLLGQIEWLKSYVANLNIQTECFTHGNLTLENILIHPETLDVKFIDPYDENIVDCREADFSQILQCSRSHYGVMSDYEPEVDGASVTLDYVVPKSISQFDTVITKMFQSESLELNIGLLDFLHVSQFVRMLPFKVQAGNREKAILFYALSCKLVDEMRQKYGD